MAATATTVTATVSAGAKPAEASGAIPAHWDGLGPFIRFLEQHGELRRVAREVDPVLEVSAIAQHAVRAGGPALLFERVKGSRVPLLINTYATRRRVSWALGVGDLDEHARAIAALVKSQPPDGLVDKLRMLPKLVRTAPCQEVVETDVDLGRLPTSPPGRATAAPTSRCRWW